MLFGNVFDKWKKRIDEAVNLAVDLSQPFPIHGNA